MNEDKASKDEIQKLAEERNVTVYVNEFTEESAKEFYEEFKKAEESGQDIIPIVIDSYGGVIDALLLMVDLIKACEKPVATICMGKAMSCGAFLLTCGDEGMRYIGENARVMIHHASGFSWDKTPQVKVDAKELERLETVVFSIIAENCGKSKEYFLEQIKDNLDWYLTPVEALRHNIVNHIGLPKLKTTVTIENELVC